jgi:hypothetical protein
MSSEATAPGHDLITDEMRGITGKVLRSRKSYPISASDIRKWAIAAYYPESPPEKYIGAGVAGGEAPLVAPEEFSPFAWATPGAKPAPSDIRPGFLERSAGITPPDLQFIVNGGSLYEYGVPMVEGDVITNEYSIKSYTVKQGKRGPLLVTETQDRWTNQKGELVRSTLMTLVRY